MHINTEKLNKFSAIFFATVIFISIVVSIAFRFLCKIEIKINLLEYLLFAILSMFLLYSAFRNVYSNLFKYIFLISSFIAYFLLFKIFGSHQGLGYIVGIASFIIILTSSLYLDKLLVVLSSILSIFTMCGSYMLYNDSTYYNEGFPFIGLSIISIILLCIILYYMIGFCNKAIENSKNNSLESENRNKVLIDSVATSVNSINKFNNKLSSNVSTLAKSTSRILSIYSSFSSSGKIINDCSQNLTSFLKEISDYFNAIDTNVEQVHASINSINGIYVNSKNNVSELNSEINTIENKINNIINSVKELNQYMNVINKTLKTIGEVSNRTNLISINSSIESAKISDKTAGFDDLSVKIKNLSLSSKESIEQIYITMNDIVLASQITLKYGNEMKEALLIGKNSIRSIENTVNNINNTVSHLENNFSEIKTYNSSVINNSDSLLSNLDKLNTGSDILLTSSEEVLALLDKEQDGISYIVNDFNNLSTHVNKVNDSLVNKEE